MALSFIVGFEGEISLAVYRTRGGLAIVGIYFSLSLEGRGLR
jgi:hypothetical protein